MKRIAVITIVSLVLGYWLVDFLHKEYYVKKYAYGLKYDQSRTARGIPEIGNELVQVEGNYSFWVNLSDIYPQHAMKELQFEDGKIVIERDDYINYSGEGYKEILSSYYHYGDSCLNIYFYPKEGSDRVEVTCGKANAILKEFGVKFRFEDCKLCD